MHPTGEPGDRSSSGSHHPLFRLGRRHRRRQSRPRTRAPPRHPRRRAPCRRPRHRRSGLVLDLRGGNFGVAVDFTFQAREVGPEVALAAVFHEASTGADLMRQWRDLSMRAGDEVTTRVMYWSLPDVEELPPPVRGQDVFIVAALFAGTKEDGAEIIGEFRDLGEPLFDMSDLIPNYRAFQSGFDPLVKDLYSY